ncbi:hypothetical protein SAMN05216410_0033 [Sanguibacter gelidistatuariae]|uniref:Cof subfamily of IIB subfamily of haloacid dehalogenase superfamily/HAD-superfamily hydrolase, subfamily IIB n=1 Tax=Sanguibacter gelidistatuariae TaxID=1814289 RepID=A0A1G6WZH6_9MICO|nr:HAD-IIB family hydrolase [Sanguibacter gelidistatuariae]SDD70597.1 hypothetical protein SAMN05216410_0033 [Sanguibacter gelidistatuariae]
MATPRVVATDLDGTLLRSDGSLSARTRGVLAGLDDRGIQVVFVTARPPRWLDAVADAVGGHGLAICLNGSCVVEVATGAVSQVRGFDAATLTAVISDLRSALPGIALGLERPDGPIFDPHYASDHHAPPSAPHAAVEDHLDAPVGKLLARLGTMAPDAFFAAVEQVIGPRAQLAYSGAIGLAEMTAPGVSKAAALARWCAAHDVSAADVWAFGDMPNDLPMLTWAGTSFAVANAHDDVLAAATRVTASNDDDGVARALEGLLAP